MKNETIIMNERLALMEQGVIGTTGKTITITNAEGKKVKVQEPEEIHTYGGWKKVGRQVMKGEKAKASFMIYKHTVKKAKEENAEDKEYMFQTKAFWFKESQTEAIAMA